MRRGPPGPATLLHMTTSTSLLPPGSAVSRPRASVSRRRSGRLVTCVGARGGAGASVFAAALARTGIRAGLTCLLVDGDPRGSGLDLLLGAEDAPGIRWPDLALARGTLVAGTLADGLPLIDGIRVLAWDRTASAVPLLPQSLPAVLEAGLAEHDLVVLDLPRSDTGLGALAELVDLGLLVIPAEVRAAAAAPKVVEQVYAGVAEVRLVVRGPSPTGLTAHAIGAVLQLPIVANMRAEPGVSAALDRGEPPGLRARGPLARGTRAVLDVLGLKQDGAVLDGH